MGRNSTNGIPSPVADGGGARAAGGGGRSRPFHQTIIATGFSAERARGLRRDATPPERILWRYLRAKQIAGLKFRRQHPLGPYITDFYCPARVLAIEIDGNAHAHDQKRHDLERDKWMESRRIRVIRVPAREIFSNIEGVVRTIEREVTSQSPLRQLR